MKKVALYFIASIISSVIVYRFISPHTKEQASYAHSEPLEAVKMSSFMRDFESSHAYGRALDNIAENLTTKLACTGQESRDRVCRIQNLCYDARRDQFFSLNSDGRLKLANMKKSDTRFLDLTSVNDHNVFYFDFDEKLSASYPDVIFVEKTTFIFARFMYDNVMHSIHDDFIGQYILHKQFSPQNGTDTIDTDNYLFFFDGHEKTPHDHLFGTLSRHPFLYRHVLRNEASPMPICFKDAIVGNSKEGAWYEYGFFSEPQGPIQSVGLTGKWVKDAANYLLAQYKLDQITCKQVHSIFKRMRSRSSVQFNSGAYITIFSRTKNRLVLNEETLIASLSSAFGLSVRVVRIESLSFEEILDTVSKSVIAIGMHGSALIFSIFMPRNAILIELFPYAISASNYTPYKTAARLNGIDLIYRSWTNPLPSWNRLNNLKELRLSASDTIYANVLSIPSVPPHLCCDSPYWNTRIYQDTYVDIEAIENQIRSGIEDAVSRKTYDLQLKQSQHRVKGIFYEVQESDAHKIYRCIIKWKNPWRSLKIVPKKYGIWIEEYAREIEVTEGLLVIEACDEGSELNLWIRPFNDYEPAAPYSRKFTLKCILINK